MDIIKRKHEEPNWFGDIDRSMNELFDVFWLGKPRTNALAATQGFALDVEDEKDHYVVQADLPGFKKEDIKIEMDGDLLTIRGERRQETEKKHKGSSYSERSFGAFVRTVRLGGEVREDGIKATLKNGVLKLELPKAKPTSAKQIDIKVEE